MRNRESDEGEQEMIKGLHALLYTPNAEEVREFIRDKLDLPYTDTGEGWLIFDVPEADLGCHPSDKPFHSISFYCDDINKTVKDLKSRGVEFTSGITDESWGMLTHFRMPGNMDVELYEPKYKKHPQGKLPSAETAKITKTKAERTNPRIRKSKTTGTRSKRKGQEKGR